MNRSKIVLGFLLAVVLGLILSVKLAEAGPWGIITIKSDGSVVTLPQTEYIKQEGNVYYLTQSIFSFRLVINCSNVVFDGQGFTIDAAHDFIYGGNGITLQNVNNVTIKDVAVIGFSEASISVSHCSDITILRVHTDPQGPLVGDIRGCIWLQNSDDNKILNCVTGVRVDWGSGNTIYGNNATLLINSPNNLIYYNNIEVQYYLRNGVERIPYPIVGSDLLFNRWDNGSAGNCWSDYNGQGGFYYVLGENNTDHYPLTQKVLVPSMNTTPTVTSAPTITPTVPEFPILPAIILLTAVVLFTAVMVGVKKNRSWLRKFSPIARHQFTILTANTGGGIENVKKLFLADCDSWDG